MFRDRRGAGMTEYAIILFVILVLAAVVFKLVGGRVKGAGSATTSQFGGAAAGDNGAGGGAGAGGATAGGKDDKSKGDKQGDQTGASGDQGQTGDQTQGQTAGGGAAAHGSRPGTGTGATGDGAGPSEPEEEEHQYPIMKILAGVLVTFFAIAAYFVFRKGKKGG